MSREEGENQRRQPYARLLNGGAAVYGAAVLLGNGWAVVSVRYAYTSVLDLNCKSFKSAQRQGKKKGAKLSLSVN